MALLLNIITEPNTITMRIRLILLTALIGLVLPSCYIENGDNVNGFNFFGEGVTGEGEVIRKTLDIKEFQSISLQGSPAIVITQSSTFKVEAEGQENIINLLSKEVEGGTWKARFTKNVRNYKKLTIYVSMPKVENLQISGSGNINSTNAFEGQGAIRLSISGSGNIGMKLEAESVEARISGSGKIGLEGKAGSLQGKISGSGDINASGFSVRNADISISGSGSTHIDVSESLKAHIGGSGDIYYTGQATNVEQKVSGSGNVVHKN